LLGQCSGSLETCPLSIHAPLEGLCKSKGVRECLEKVVSSLQGLVVRSPHRDAVETNEKKLKTREKRENGGTEVSGENRKGERRMRGGNRCERTRRMKRGEREIGSESKKTKMEKHEEKINVIEGKENKIIGKGSTIN